MKYLIFLFCVFTYIFSFAQEDLVWKNILKEDFNNNNNGWYIGSDDLRKSSINSGVLSDWFGEAGYSQGNRISVNVNSNNNYLISFSIANINGDANKKYRVYEKKKDGTLKESWESDPTWGFVWGFKDWDNYNCILFNHNREYNSYAVGNYLYGTSVKIFYKSNGQTKTLLDWKEFKYWGNEKIEVNIEQYNDNSVRIYSGSGLVIYSYSGGVFQWYGDKIGPYVGAGANIEMDYVYVREKKPHVNTNFNELSLKSYWQSSGADFIEGIYEKAISTDGSPKYKLALKKSDVGYNLIYLSGADNSGWVTGDIKAYLSATATPNFFKAIWFMGDKTPQDNLYISFEAGSMKIIWTDKKEDLYIKLYPTSNDNISISGASNSISSGTGIAISSSGIIATNYHVIDGAKTINIRGINSDFNKTYKAKVLLSDKNNDLALLQIDDYGFNSLGSIPFTIKTGLSGVGENIFVLGYPLRATMGDEIKLTNGIISSKTGFQGDITSYQISAPVQPGNSGGPLFDNQGNLIGVINAKHIGAENASYAVKTSYLTNLIDLLPSPPKLQTVNSLTGKTLTQQVELVKKFVYIIETE